MALHPQKSEPAFGTAERVAAVERGSRPAGQTIDLIHTTTEVDEEAQGRLVAAANAARMHLHLLVSGTDGRLSGARLRALIPDWA